VTQTVTPPGQNNLEGQELTLQLTPFTFIIANCYYPTNNNSQVIYGIDFDVNALQVTALDQVENEDIMSKPDDFGLVFQVIPQLLELFPQRLSITKIIANIQLKQMDCIGVVLFDTKSGHSCFHNQDEHIHYCQNCPIGDFLRSNLVSCLMDGWTTVNKCNNQHCWLYQ